MSKALSFRAKSKMLGQDSVPFKIGYVIGGVDLLFQLRGPLCQFPLLVLIAGGQKHKLFIR